MDEVRRLLDDVALLDADAAGEDELRVLIDEVRTARTHADRQPDFRATGLTFSGGWNAALDQRSPVSGLMNPLAAPLVIETVGDKTYAHAVFGAAYEGPPGILHGGMVSAAFDELLGAAQMASGIAGMTAMLSVKMRRPTPLHTRIEYEAGLDRVDGRKIYASGKSMLDGHVLGEAEALFIAFRAD